MPAAASVVGAAPFFSDARLFNTSYTSSLTVSARYRCFIGTCSSAPQSVTIGPRQSMAFDDICVSLFSSPNSAGAIEFEWSGSEDQLVVTSRLYSTAPMPTVGMFVPALKNSEGHGVTVLTGISNAGAGAGFRTNVGAFNPNDSAVTATFKVLDGGAPVGAPLERTLGPHSGVQINNIFGALQQGGHATTNAVVVVESDNAAELFTYAAVIDNATTDPILVLGARDVPAGAMTKSVGVGAGGDRFVDEESSSSTTTIRVGDTVRWDWVASLHSTTSGSCAGGCVKDGKWDSGEHTPPFTFSRTFNDAGSFPYWCTVHGAMMTGTVVVNP